MKKLGLALLSAFLLTSAQPFSVNGAGLFVSGWNGLLAWIALVPLWLAVREMPARRGAALCFLFGFVHSASALYWLVIALHVYGGLGLFLSLLLLFLLSAWLALFPAVAGVTAFTFRSKVPPELFFPLAWAGMEWLRGIALTGFPWISLSASQWRLLWPLQVSDLLGPEALSGLIVLVNTAISEALVRSPGRRRLLMVAGITTAALVYGALRVAFLDAERVHRPTLAVDLVQGDVSQDVKHDHAFDAAVRHRYNAALAASSASLVVWPEAALPSAVHLRSERLIQPDLEISSSSWLLAGAATWWQDSGEIRAHNSALLVEPGGRIASRYDKIHLVPFGEYVPLSRLLFFVRKLTHGAGDFLPGASSLPLAIPGARLGILVCYEDVFPAIARREVRQGADVLVNLTNDAWYGRSSAPWQHLSMSVLRAVETRRPLLRATQSGVTAEIDDAGRVLATVGVFGGPATLSTHPALGGPPSPFLFTGDLFGPICLFSSAFFWASLFVGVFVHRGFPGQL